MSYEFLKDQDRPDAFEWGPARQTLKDAILALPPPGCVAVYGPWGAGKSTLLNHLRKLFVEAVTVWFDPWEYERSGDVVGPLLRAIFAQLSESKELPDDWHKRALKLIGKLSKLTLDTAYKVAQVGALHWGVSLPELPKELEKLSVEEIKNWFNDEQKKDEIQSVKSEFQELVLAAMKDKPKQRLVVFLDDLDRCLPDTALSVIEATKLLLCAKPLEDARSKAIASERPDGSLLPVIFVFALDRQLVGEAIANHYKASTAYTGESYLEKIFDVSIEVPPTNSLGLATLIGSLELLKSFAPQKEDANFFVKALSNDIFSNPRVLMRTMNRLQLLTRGMHRIKGWPTELSDWQRMVWWMGGIERYRAFRLTFFSATPAEIRALHFHLNPPNDEPVAPLASHALKQILGMPRFAEFYRTMFAGYQAPRVDAERSPRALASDPMTLCEIEGLLRSLGI